MIASRAASSCRIFHEMRAGAGLHPIPGYKRASAPSHEGGIMLVASASLVATAATSSSSRDFAPSPTGYARADSAGSLRASIRAAPLITSAVIDPMS